MSAKRQITIRRATLAEEAEIRALQDAALRIQGSRDYEPGEVASFIAHVGTLDRQSLAEGTCFVAVVGGEIVASGSWTAQSAAFERYATTSAWDPAGPVIHGVYVDPVYAESGLAQRILRALEDDLSAAGYTEARLATVYGGMPFYSTAGYRPCQLVSLALPDGTEIHGVRMAKPLCATAHAA
jgi:predicted N-acetyltransferase YhbS